MFCAALFTYFSLTHLVFVDVGCTDWTTRRSVRFMGSRIIAAHHTVNPSTCMDLLQDRFVFSSKTLQTYCVLHQCVCGSGLNVCDQKCEWASESEWAYLWEQRDWEGHCGIEGRWRMTLWHWGDRIRGRKQREPGGGGGGVGRGGSPSCQLWGAAGRLSGSPAWPPGCLVTTARPWNAPTHNELLGLRGHSDLITTLKS